MLFRKYACLTVAAVLAGLWTSPAVAQKKGAAKPIAIADVKRSEPVEFQKDVLPVLEKSCTACHNVALDEGGLSLEDPQSILKGGRRGPAVVPGKSAESKLLKFASHQAKPYMPPLKNSVEAQPLKPEELGLIKLWIDQGAKGSVSKSAAPLVWQPLPEGIHPIYSLAMTADGQYIACGRANQIFLYHLPTKKLVTRLTDPGLLKGELYNKRGVAHLDMVQSLAFNRQGDRLASGGFRNVKIWKKPANPTKFKLPVAGSEVNAVAISPDGKWMATGAADKSIKLIDMASGKEAKSLGGHGGPVTSVAFSPDSAKLVSGSMDKTIRVWNIADGKELFKIDSPTEVRAVTVVTKGTQIAAGGNDNLIRIWPIAKPEPPAEKKEGEKKEGEQAEEALKPIRELQGHGKPVVSLATLPSDDNQIISGSEDNTLRHWRVDNGQNVRSFNHGGPVYAVATSPDGKIFASASANSSAKIWRGDNGQQIAEVKGDHRIQTQVALHERELKFVTNDVNGYKKQLDDAKKDLPKKQEAQKKTKEEMDKANKEFASKKEAFDKIAAEKKELDKVAAETAAAAQKAEKARKDADTALASAKKEVESAQKIFDQAAKSADANKDNATLAKAKQDAEKALNAAKEKLQKSEQAKQAADKALQDAQKAAKDAENKAKAKQKPFTDAEKAFTDAKAAKEKADREFAAAEKALKAAQELVPSSEASLKQSEEAQKQLQAKVEAAKKAFGESAKPVTAVAINADGGIVATAGEDGKVYLWDAASGQSLDVYEGHAGKVQALAFAGNSLLASVGADKQAVVWDTMPEWQLERTIGSPQDAGTLVHRVLALDFSHDGELLAAGSGEPSRTGELKVFKVADGSLVKEFPEAHSDTIFDVEFSRNSKYLASCAADKFVKVFDVQAGKLVRSFEGHTHHVLGVSWQADVSTLASAGADNVIKVWNFETGEQKRTIKGYNKQVTAITFIGDSDNTLSASGDKTVRMHRTSNGQNFRNFGGGTDFMNAVAVTPDSKIVVSGGADGVVRVWQENGQAIATFEPPKPEEEAVASSKQAQK